MLPAIYYFSRPDPWWTNEKIYHYVLAAFHKIIRPNIFIQQKTDLICGRHNDLAHILVGNFIDKNRCPKDSCEFAKNQIANGLNQLSNNYGLPLKLLTKQNFTKQLFYLSSSPQKAYSYAHCLILSNFSYNLDALCKCLNSLDDNLTKLNLDKAIKSISSLQTQFASILNIFPPSDTAMFYK